MAFMIDDAMVFDIAWRSSRACGRRLARYGNSQSGSHHVETVLIHGTGQQNDGRHAEGKRHNIRGFTFIGIFCRRGAPQGHVSSTQCLFAQEHVAYAAGSCWAAVHDFTTFKKHRGWWLAGRNVGVWLQRQALRGKMRPRVSACYCYKSGSTWLTAV